LDLRIQAYALIIDSIEIRGRDPYSQYYYPIHFHLNLKICLITSMELKSIINIFKKS